MARGLAPATRDMLCDAGIVVVDAQRLFGGSPRAYFNGTTAAEARRDRRTVSGYVQGRTDGALTYYKFAGW